ncbi:MAG: small multi-drug export protein [Candidatus Buchananbacteria bacterium]
MQFVTSLFVFLLVYVFGSNLVSIPTGLALGLNQFLVIGLVIGLDFLQIPLFFFLFEQGQSRFKLVKILFNILPNSETVQGSFLKNIIEHGGQVSVMLVTAMPTFGGGIWTGVLVSHMLKLDRSRSVFFILVGAVINATAVWIGSATIWLVIKSIFIFVTK